jgi:hypothetical protein
LKLDLEADDPADTGHGLIGALAIRPSALRSLQPEALGHTAADLLNLSDPSHDTVVQAVPEVLGRLEIYRVRVDPQTADNCNTAMRRPIEDDHP